jgi:hypothetical protein
MLNFVLPRLLKSVSDQTVGMLNFVLPRLLRKRVFRQQSKDIYTHTHIYIYA